MAADQAAQVPPSLSAKVVGYVDSGFKIRILLSSVVYYNAECQLQIQFNSIAMINLVLIR